MEVVSATEGRVVDARPGDRCWQAIEGHFGVALVLCAAAFPFWLSHGAPAPRGLSVLWREHSAGWVSPERSPPSLGHCGTGVREPAWERWGTGGSFWPSRCSSSACGWDPHPGPRRCRCGSRRWPAPPITSSTPCSASPCCSVRRCGLRVDGVAMDRARPPLGRRYGLASLWAALWRRPSAAGQRSSRQRQWRRPTWTGRLRGRARAVGDGVRALQGPD